MRLGARRVITPGRKPVPGGALAGLSAARSSTGVVTARFSGSRPTPAIRASAWRFAAPIGMMLGALLVLALSFGCGYSQKSLFAESRRLVAVRIFENDTFYRELEFALTDQVVRELQRRQGVTVVDEARAQVILRGRITGIEQRVLAENERDRPREVGATTTVQVSLLDGSTGKLLKNATVRDRAEFVTGRGETLLTAQRESFADLARRIVYVLEEGF